MVQKVNIISQRLSINLLPQHKIAVLYYKIFFCFKLLLDHLLVNCLKQYNTDLFNFYLGYSTKTFFLNLFIFKIKQFKKIKYEKKTKKKIKRRKRRMVFLKKFITSSIFFFKYKKFQFLYLKKLLKVYFNFFNIFNKVLSLNRAINTPEKFLKHFLKRNCYKKLFYTTRLTIIPQIYKSRRELYLFEKKTKMGAFLPYKNFIGPYKQTFPKVNNFLLVSYPAVFKVLIANKWLKSKYQKKKCQRKKRIYSFILGRKHKFFWRRLRRFKKRKGFRLKRNVSKIEIPKFVKRRSKWSFKTLKKVDKIIFKKLKSVCVDKKILLKIKKQKNLNFLQLYYKNALKWYVYKNFFIYNKLKKFWGISWYRAAKFKSNNILKFFYKKLPKKNFKIFKRLRVRLTGYNRCVRKAIRRGGNFLKIRKAREFQKKQLKIFRQKEQIRLAAVFRELVRPKRPHEYVIKLRKNFLFKQNKQPIAIKRRNRLLKFKLHNRSSRMWAKLGFKKGKSRYSRGLNIFGHSLTSQMFIPQQSYLFCAGIKPSFLKNVNNTLLNFWSSRRFFKGIKKIYRVGFGLRERWLFLNYLKFRRFFYSAGPFWNFLTYGLQRLQRKLPHMWHRKKGLRWGKELIKVLSLSKASKKFPIVSKTKKKKLAKKSKVLSLFVENKKECEIKRCFIIKLKKKLKTLRLLNILKNKYNFIDNIHIFKYYMLLIMEKYWSINFFVIIWNSTKYVALKKKMEYKERLFGSVFILRSKPFFFKNNYIFNYNWSKMWLHIWALSLQKIKSKQKYVWKLLQKKPLYFSFFKGNFFRGYVKYIYYLYLNKKIFSCHAFAINKILHFTSKHYLFKSSKILDKPKLSMFFKRRRETAFKKKISLFYRKTFQVIQNRTIIFTESFKDFFIGLKFLLFFEKKLYIPWIYINFNFFSKIFIFWYLKYFFKVFFFNLTNIINVFFYDNFCSFFSKKCQFIRIIVLKKFKKFGKVGKQLFLIKDIKSSHIVKKKILLLTLSMVLFKTLHKNFKVNVFNVTRFLNKYNRFELFINQYCIKKKYFMRKISFNYIFFLNYSNLLVISIKCKQFGLFVKFICEFLGSKRRQWFSIKLIKRCLRQISITTYGCLGMHLLISGTINGCQRTKRFHVIKLKKCSQSNLALEVYYNQRQSFSVYGALGLKIWFYY